MGGKARCVAVVGLGPAAKAQPVAAWGASPFQVPTVFHPLTLLSHPRDHSPAVLA